VKAADDKLSALASAFTEINAEKEGASVRVEEATTQLAAHNVSRTEAETLESLAKKSLDGTKEAQSVCEAEYEKLQSALDFIQKGIDKDLPTLSGKLAIDENNPAVTYDALKPMIALLAVDVSLATALTSTCAKKPTELGQFDTMVIEQLETSARAKSKELSAKISELESVRTEKASAVNDATTALNERQEQCTAVCDKIKATELSLDQAKTALQSAEDRLNKHGPDSEAAQQSKAEVNAQLQEFLGGALVSFQTLRDRKQADSSEVHVREEKSIEASPTSKVDVTLEVPQVEVAVAGA